MYTTINFNGGFFEITAYNSDGTIEKIRRTTEPKIEVDVTQLGDKLKMSYWENYKRFTYGRHDYK